MPACVEELRSAARNSKLFLRCSKGSHESLKWVCAWDLKLFHRDY